MRSNELKALKLTNHDTDKKWKDDLPQILQDKEWRTEKEGPMYLFVVAFGKALR